MGTPAARRRKSHIFPSKGFLSIASETTSTLDLDHRDNILVDKLGPNSGVKSHSQSITLESSLDSRRPLTDDQESTGNITLPLGTSDDPIDNESSPEKPAETTQIDPSYSLSRPRRNPGLTNFYGKRRFVEKISPSEVVDLMEASEEEPIFSFFPATNSGAKQLHGNFQLDSQSSFLTPFGDFPRKRSSIADTTQCSTTIPSSVDPHLVVLCSPENESQHDKTSLDSDILSIIDSETRV